MPTDSADDSIIDVTGLLLKLNNALQWASADLPRSTPALPPTSGYSYYNDYEPPSLARFYKEKLALTPRQISWLNRFPLPTNTFLDVEAGREATVRLYLAVLPLLEQQLKSEGSTLAQTVKTLDGRAKSLRYYASTTWYYTPPKTGADTYLAIFRLCENAARAHLGHKRKITSLFGGSLAELEPDFRELLGRRVPPLLPPLLALLPAPDHATERLLNKLNTSRWKAELAQLVTSPAANAPAFVAALDALAARNADNPAVGALYQEATKRLAARHPEAALGYHLRYLHGVKARYAEAKPLPKALQKQLFSQPEQAKRFQVMVNELAFSQNLEEALAKLPKVYEVQRRKIELDRHAIHAVRDQHSGTVELLNEYLRDETVASPPPGKTPAPAKPAKSRKVAAKPPRTAADPPPPAAARCVGSLVLDIPQRVLLQLFAAHKLALSQAQVEALAISHGTLRHQLIDGLNEACYELLDDVLVEETGDGYTIYQPYYHKITA
ncbi:tellurite resistance TerB C-terminal domain-containing protein [Hymenobacter rubripertinctus]|uniref:TerB-C domain-containing protein n=1 Tax=Hymenobacter rubripertinctus TaxID=2029981 RepID=A0A418QM96_9BACT|nr:tellurite resistance TerB C-terminal domain-containing protein [Hymenobacter rubripertinctus]RIY06229.1 hypothetical protein D0T11_19055 [Hymenobacter rubripertinctus]